MITQDCNTNLKPIENKPADWSLDELNGRAGALVREALAHYSVKERQAHWEDMRQTAVIAFLEQADKNTGYAYAAARNALKNYVWVHIRGLNGGWKSLACIEHGYTVIDLPGERNGDDDLPHAVLDRMAAATWDTIPRPVEWEVIRRLSPPVATQEETMRQVLDILAGMSGHFYPEQMYRAALIMTLLARGYTWEHVEERTGLSHEMVFDIYWGWRKRHLRPFLALTSMHQEIIKIRGRLRVTYFEELDKRFLNTAVRKMVVFPHGIYTITYKRRGKNAGKRAGQMEASLQKGRRIDGRNWVRAVHLGKVGEITKERLYQASFAVERKLAALGATKSLGDIHQSRQVVFAS
ncbi:MAG: hypothetical protein ACE5FD_07490 [Anaerolineae bacterium]